MAVQIVGPQKRQEVMEEVKQLYPNLIVVDYTLPHCVVGKSACTRGRCMQPSVCLTALGLRRLRAHTGYLPIGLFQTTGTLHERRNVACQTTILITCTAC